MNARTSHPNLHHRERGGRGEGGRGEGGGGRGEGTRERGGRGEEGGEGPSHPNLHLLAALGGSVSTRAPGGSKAAHRNRGVVSRGAAAPPGRLLRLPLQPHPPVNRWQHPVPPSAPSVCDPLMQWSTSSSPTPVLPYDLAEGFCDPCKEGQIVGSDGTCSEWIGRGLTPCGGSSSQEAADRQRSSQPNSQQRCPCLSFSTLFPSPCLSLLTHRAAAAPSLQCVRPRHTHTKCTLMATLFSKAACRARKTAPGRKETRASGTTGCAGAQTQTRAGTTCLASLTAVRFVSQGRAALLWGGVKSLPC
jgi:hypothetical protein